MAQHATQQVMGADVSSDIHSQVWTVGHSTRPIREFIVLLQSAAITIVGDFDGDVAGHVLSFEQLGHREVSYWIGKKYWGKGVATHALAEFLGLVKMRPFFARAAKNNLPSLRVLEKCGFTICGEDKGLSNARGVEVEEFMLRLGPK